MHWKNKSVIQLIKNNMDEDPIEIIREKSREVVVKAYDLGWEGPPFDPIKLAQILGYEILPNEDIIDARTLSPQNKSFRIEYNPFQRDTRINFSIAHEIGHTLFDDCHERIRNRESNLDDDNREVELLCNIAASEILLPYAEFSSEVNSIALNLDSLLKISNKYKASVESVFLRFCEVINKPCSIILASFTSEEQKELVVEYSKSSKLSDLFFENGYKIPTDSNSYECLNSGWTSHSIENWKIFNNESYKIYSIGLPPIKRTNNKRVGILLVPETLASEDTSNIYMVNGDATKPRGNGNKIIGQIINTSGGLGFGFGKAMSTNWPTSKKSVIKWMEDKSDFVLGNSKLTKLSDDTYVFQMIAQKGIFPKGETIPLRYDSLRQCLLELGHIAKTLNASVHMPKIGAGQAKGDWSLIEGMIYETIISEGISVSIYILPGTKIVKPKQSANLTLFD
jgi:Zn-dependent peptidase ImmA (M78 family)